MSMKLVILGLLMEANRHTYEIRQTMKERGMHNYMKLQDGSPLLCHGSTAQGRPRGST